MTDITFPEDVNGVTEIGIAAGADEFVDNGYVLTVVLSATAAAPVKPTILEEAAADLHEKYLNLDKGSERTRLMRDDAFVTGGRSVSRLEVLGMFRDEIVSASSFDDIYNLGGDHYVKLVDDYADWYDTEINEMKHVEIDVKSTLRANVPPGTTDAIKKFWQTAIVHIMRSGWIIKREDAANGLVRYVKPYDAYAVKRSSEEVNNLGFVKFQIAANVIVASKINWWLTNHHVGQTAGTVEGFAGKVATIGGILVDNNPSQNIDARKTIWALGKMCSTRGILRGIGIKSIICNDTSNTGDITDNDFPFGGELTINVSDDVKLRIESNPAGTAKLAVYHEVAMRASRSIYGICVPPLNSLGYDFINKEYTGIVADKMEAMRTSPADFHMGAVFLTGRNRVSADAWDEEDMGNLSAFIYAVNSTSTLAKSKAIMSEGDVKGLSTYTTIIKVRTALADVATDKMTMAYLQQLTGGSLKGGMARQFGRLTDDQIRAANDRIEAEGGEAETVDVADDSGPVTRKAKAAKVVKRKRGA